MARREEMEPYCLVIVMAIALLISTTIAKDPCTYTVFVATGKAKNSSTDSNITAQFYDTNGYSITVENLKLWGVRGVDPNYDYFERGHTDIFTGLGNCLTAPICALNLTSDGTGPNHGWYCSRVEVTSTGPHIPCAQHLFSVEQWLSVDTYPYQLSAFRDDCIIDDESRLSSKV